MATELATAYLTLVPSLKGVKSSIESQLGGVDTSGASKSLGNKFVSGFSGAVKGISTAAIGATVAAGAAVSAGLAGITKSALAAYSANEQLVGGVETLFKDSADAVQAYAADAYKTAGMSSNDYMSTVTSFSASLLQGLGGDTAAAAEIANQAVTDMSDNANKMGTDISMIQNAYQGFAKQNYTINNLMSAA